MSKTGQSILRGAGEARAFAGGDKKAAREHVVMVPDEIDVKTIRHKLGMSQREFALAYGFKRTAVQAWEQGRRKPDRSARILLTIIDKEPETISRVLVA